jgi:hypothetical protein
MIHLMASCEPPPVCLALTVKVPDCPLLAAGPLSHFGKGRQYHLDEVIKSGPMYEIFLEYLEKNMCAENLKCVRMISIFEALMAHAQAHPKDAPAQQAAAAQAWDIFRFFVAPGSAYEVSCHHLVRKRVMLTLATPVPGMFEAVRKSAHDTLAINFESFRKSAGYDRLASVMRSAKQAYDRKGTRGTIGSAMKGSFATAEAEVEGGDGTGATKPVPAAHAPAHAPAHASAHASAHPTAHPTAHAHANPHAQAHTRSHGQGLGVAHANGKGPNQAQGKGQQPGPRQAHGVVAAAAAASAAATAALTGDDDQAADGNNAGAGANKSNNKSNNNNNSSKSDTASGKSNAASGSGKGAQPLMDEKKRRRDKPAPVMGCFTFL